MSSQNIESNNPIDYGAFFYAHKYSETCIKRTPTGPSLVSA